jgi:hypothetical protein
MSTTNNTTANTAADTKDDIAFTKMFNRSGLKQLVIAHQHTIDYMGTVANIYNPMVYMLPKEVAEPTTVEKAVLAKMIKREKNLMGKIKRLIEVAEKDCDELLAKIGFRNTWATGWNDGWGNASQPQANKNGDGAVDNAEAN